MYDCHYDLLTYIYMNKNNLEEVKKYCDQIFNNNIQGGIFNLFYMSQEEMLNELGIKDTEINVIDNIKEVKQIIKENNLIPEKIDYVLGIEGLDYVEKINDIEVLYELGVKSVNPVWNNHNKFGTGVRPIKILNKNKGLTELGEELIKKLIQLGITIDMSHADEETFWNIIDVCKRYKSMSPKIIASHSNCKSICDAPRNLSDEQIKVIAEFNGIIGIVGIKQFCSTDNEDDFKQKYIEHINYINNLLGGVDNIAISTDDMSYYKINREHYQNVNVFKQKEIREQANKLLKVNNYSENEISRIMRENYKRVLKKDSHY